MTASSPLGSNCPVLDVDPFSKEFLTSPYVFHEQLREAGSAIWLPRYGVVAMARHAEVQSALNDWQTFCSSRGGGLTDFNKEKPWRQPSIVLEADPPLHTRTRGVLMRVLSRPAVEKLRVPFTAKAEALIGNLVERGSFDAVKHLAEAYPLTVFPDSVGIAKEGRENLLPYGNMAFNAFGPRNTLFEESFKDAQQVIGWITTQCRREVLSPEGFGAQIYAEADAGQISQEEAALLVRSLLTAGLDTTIFGIGAALFCFASYPDQWLALREDSTLARPAFEEVIRFISPVQTFFRTTTKQIDIAGVQIPDGQKVLLFLAAANRDPRKWEEPQRFNIRRKAGGHVGFGHGIHMCVGQMIARLEAEIVLTALVKRVAAIELDGEPMWRLNNTLHGLDRLAVRLRPA
jgi:cytochrome P450